MRRSSNSQFGLKTVLWAAAVIAGLEGAARLSPPPPESDPVQVQWLIESWAPLLHVETVEGKERLVQGATVMADSLAQTFPLRKQAGTRRILVVGESSALHFGQALRRALSQAGPVTDVMNLSIAGGSLEQVERRFKEGMRYSPDAVVVMFGHNLFARRPYVTRNVYRAGRWLRTSRLFAVAADALFPISWEHTDESQRHARLERFLRTAAREGREKRVALVFCTVPSNLRFPPRYNREELESAERLESLFRRHSGDLRGAAAALEAPSQRQTPPLWTFEKADLHHRWGDAVGARRLFIEARDADRDRNRTSSAVNDIIRRVASEEKADLLDAAALVDALAPDGIPGWETFKDQMHVREDVFAQEAAACVEILKNRLGGLPRPAAAETPSGQGSAVDFVRSALHHAEQSPHHFEEALSHKFEDVLRRRVVAEVAELKGLLEGGDPQVFEKVRNKPLARARLWLAYGKACGRLKRFREAADAFEQAEKLGVSWPAPDFWAGIFLLENGDRAGAAARFEEALRKSPDSVPARFMRDRIKI